MKDTLKQIAHESLDSLATNPILKGAVPALAGAGMTFVEELEIWLRITGVVIGIAVGSLTLYVTYKKAKKEDIL